MKNKIRVQVFTRSYPNLSLVTQSIIGSTWYEDTSNETDNISLTPTTTNDNSHQQNYFYNYRYETNIQ